MPPYNWRKEGIFGPQINQTRESRIFSIGVGIGLVVAGIAPHPADYILAAFGLFVVVVRSLAQVRWPDEPPP